MTKKYELVKSISIQHEGHTLYRIRALKNMLDLGVSRGDLGGYVEDYENLSQEGNCWIYDHAKCWMNGHVAGNAKLMHDSEVYGHAVVSDRTRVRRGAKVEGNAMIVGNAYVQGNVLVTGFSTVADHASVSALHSSTVVVAEHATIADRVEVCCIDDPIHFGGHTYLRGRVRIGSGAYLEKGRDVLSFYPVGSENGVLTTYARYDGSIGVTRGCFAGTLEKFEQKVQETHANNEDIKQEYLKLSEIVRHRFRDLKPVEGEHPNTQFFKA